MSWYQEIEQLRTKWNKISYKDNPLYEQIYYAKKKWAEFDRVASVLEKMEKSLIGVLIEDYKQINQNLTIAKAEHQARASKQYINHIDKTTEARMEAHIVFAEVEGIREKIEAFKSKDIQNMVEMKYSK